MRNIAGLTPPQIIVTAAISIGGVLALPHPWNWLVFAAGLVIGVVLQQLNIQRFHKQVFQDPDFSEAEIIDLTRRALAGEFPINQEPSPLKMGGQVLTFEPFPGRKIVVGTIGNGKAHDQH